MKYGIDMSMSQFEEDPGAKKILDETLPGLWQMTAAFPMAKDMSVRQIAGYAKGRIPQEAVEALDAKLKAYGADKGPTEAEIKKMEGWKKLAEADQKAFESAKAAGVTRTSIEPGKVWLDTHGNRIQAHGGALFYEDSTYYWYGENKEHTDGVSSIWTWGIRAYRSKDLINWEDLGLIIPPVLDDLESDLSPEAHLDRPHINKCPQTGRYVAWIKLSGKESCFIILEADSFTGPYTVIRENYRPEGHHIGDFDIVVDEENRKSYLYADVDHAGIACYELTDDMHACKEHEVAISYRDAKGPFTREGVAMFEHAGTRYMITSGMTGYIPNQSDSASADAWDQEFRSIGDPHIGDETMASFNSQISQVFRVPDRDLYIAIADRWVPEYPIDHDKADMFRRIGMMRIDPVHYHASEEEVKEYNHSPMLKTADTSIADYVWLPVTFKDGKPQIEWLDSWNPADHR